METFSGFFRVGGESSTSVMYTTRAREESWEGLLGFRTVTMREYRSRVSASRVEVTTRSPVESLIWNGVVGGVSV